MIVRLVRWSLLRHPLMMPARSMPGTLPGLLSAELLADPPPTTVSPSRILGSGSTEDRWLSFRP